MRITHVMRGDDHISNTPKQILLYRALGAELPVFAHFPMIHGMDGKKLSKRHGATAVGDYQHQGILPEAMCNFLALLGWSPGGDREIMTRDEMVALFNESGWLAKASIFDPKKLEWMNGQHLARMPLDALLPRARTALVAAGVATDAELALDPARTARLVDLLRVRARTLDDLARQARPYFRDPVDYDPDSVRKQWKDPAQTRALLTGARVALAAVPAWEPAALEAATRHFAEGRGVAAGAVLQPLRVAIVGVAASPGMFDVLQIVGRERSLARIDAALAHPHLAP
jgi:glutamyl-tRNA synthetase